MQNIKVVVLALFVALVTLFICVSKPQMHKQALVTGEEKTFVAEEIPSAKIQASPTTIKTTQTPVKTTQTPIKTTVVQAKSVNVNTKNQNIKQSQPKVKTVQKSTQTVSKIVKPVEQDIKTETPKVQINEVPTPTVSEKKVLTEYEETIVWNKWRSDLQNQIMKDTKIAAPLGTGFRFSFTVDKFGNMSNVNVWSTNPVYTDLANRVIKPVLVSYQKKSILNFPEGTKRIITNVNGGFVISRTTEYSTPSDYSDYETVKRTK